MFRGGIPAETQTGEGTQFDARGQSMPQETTSMFQARQDFGTAYGALDRRAT